MVFVPPDVPPHDAVSSMQKSRVSAVIFLFVIIIRTLFLYIFVTLAIRLMGKRQIADMQPNELVVTLLISEIAAIPLQDTTQPLISGIVAIFVLVIVEILLSVIIASFP